MFVHKPIKLNGNECVKAWITVNEGIQRNGFKGSKNIKYALPTLINIFRFDRCYIRIYFWHIRGVSLSRMMLIIWINVWMFMCGLFCIHFQLYNSNYFFCQFLFIHVLWLVIFIWIFCLIGLKCWNSKTE